MKIPKSFFTGIIMCFVLLFANADTFAKPSLDKIDEWYQILSSKKDLSNKGFEDLYQILYKSDSSTAFKFIQQLQAKNAKANSYFKSRFACLLGQVRVLFQQTPNKKEIFKLAEYAISESYEAADEYLIGFVSFTCGITMIKINEMEHAVTYLVKGQEIFDRHGQTIKEQYSSGVILGEVLFHCAEYEKSIYYTKKVIEIYNDTISTADYFRVRFYNTMGQNYNKLNNLDSAFAYFNKSMLLAIQVKDSVWQGINAGFLGQVHYKMKNYRQAKALLEFNYAVNEHHEFDHAAASLQWLARIDLELNRKDSALEKSQRALALLKRTGKGHYLQPSSFLQMIYHTTADVYHAMGNTDSFYHYNKLSSNLHDSLQRVALLSSLKISQLRIANENNIMAIQLLQKERKAEKARLASFIIVGILIATILCLYLNRIWLKQLHKEQLAVEQKRAAETELISAREQMQLFTQNIIEKSELVEKLKDQIVHKEISLEHNRMLDEIRTLTILTEEDWETFKKLFEKMYPGFLLSLREKARDITLAELRMAALVKLDLTSRQMASMLGISIESVHKTRQRLRQRLNITSELILKELVAEM